MDKTTKNEPPKIRKVHQKLAEFAGYTTLHGVNRMASNKRVIGKVLWCAVVLVCLGFCTRQIYLLCDQYARKPVITTISIRHQTVRFPEISFCNLNPVSSYRKDLFIPSDLFAFQYLMSQGQQKAEGGIISTLNKSKENNTTIGFSEVFQQIINSNLIVRQAMNLLYYLPVNYTLKVMKDLNPDIDDFIISCIFEGKPCKSRKPDNDFIAGRIAELSPVFTTRMYSKLFFSSLILFVPFFDKFYGLCYRFSTDSNISKTSGPVSALQLVIDVNQSDYLPSHITDAGIRLSIHTPGTKPVLRHNGMSVATGLQTDISLVQKTVERIPDATLCDDINQFNSFMECIEQCILENIKRKCNCSIGLKENHNQRICWLGRKCAEEASANLTNCNCSCRETKYEKTVTMSRWPARNFEPFLEQLYRQRGLNYSDYMDSLLALNIYLESLSEEVIKEEPAFTVENLLSNIGGSLGLWIGMSIISIGEILELMWMLCSTVLKRRRINTTVHQSNGTTVDHSDTTSVEEPDTTTVEPTDNTVV